MVNISFNQKKKYQFFVSKTLILGAHEAIPWSPESGHTNEPKTNKKRTNMEENI